MRFAIFGLPDKTGTLTCMCVCLRERDAISINFKHHYKSIDYVNVLCVVQLILL